MPKTAPFTEEDLNDLAGEEPRTQTPQWPAPLARAAFHGLPGDIVRTIEPHSESDPAALLMQALTVYGNLIGRSAYFRVESDVHNLNLFTAIVGSTSKGRKGTGWGRIRSLFREADQSWNARILDGLSSGEGLIWAVRDPIEEQQAVKEKGRVIDYQAVITDTGVEDKRLMIVQSELASTLRVLNRDGNTLSAIIRQAWDTGDLRTLTKNSPAVATAAHISIIGHITGNELRRYLDRTECGNGFANRFTWVCAKRSKVLPEGGNLRETDMAPVRERIAEAVEYGKQAGELWRDDEARVIWHRVYGELSEGRPGLLGAVTSRGEAQVVRLAGIYALMDGSAVIRGAHLRAGLAVWQYAEASARFIFGEALGDPTADEILKALKTNPAGLTRTELRDLFGRHKTAGEIGRGLALLADQGMARFEMESTGGRPVERWFALSATATKAT